MKVCEVKLRNMYIEENYNLQKCLNIVQPYLYVLTNFFPRFHIFKHICTQMGRYIIFEARWESKCSQQKVVQHWETEEFFIKSLSIIPELKSILILRSFNLDQNKKQLRFQKSQKLVLSVYVSIDAFLEMLCLSVFYRLI